MITLAYDPSIYSQQYYHSPMGTMGNQKPFNGLVQVDSVDGAWLRNLPNSSVSEPMFWKDDNIFFVKQTDADGVPSLSAYRFEECELPQSANYKNEFVTRADLEALETRIIGAINGQHIASEHEAGSSDSGQLSVKQNIQPETVGAEQNGVQQTLPV